MGQERFVFVGCVHQASPALLARLAALISNPPDYLIFCGDVTGSSKMEAFKRLFYNYVYNRARNELGIGTTHEKFVSESELLSYVGPNPPETNLPLEQGFRILQCCIFELEGDDRSTAAGRAAAIPPSVVAAGIVRIARDFEYFGPWVKTLSETVRRGVVTTIKDDAEAIADAVKPLQDAGTKVKLVCGNWDNAQSTRDNMVGEGIEVFDTLPFFDERGWEVFEMMRAIETRHALLVMVPYWELPQWSRGAEERLEEIRLSVALAKSQGETILLVGHNEPNWVIHNLQAPDPFRPLTGTRAAALESFTRVIARLRPDEVIYPHQHNPLVDGDGKPVGLNAKYLLEVEKGTVKLATKVSRSNSLNQIVASYIPFQRFGELALSDSTLRGRQPVFVS